MLVEVSIDLRMYQGSLGWLVCTLLFVVGVMAEVLPTEVKGAGLVCSMHRVLLFLKTQSDICVPFNVQLIKMYPMNSDRSLLKVKRMSC